MTESLPSSGSVESSHREVLSKEGVAGVLDMYWLDTTLLVLLAVGATLGFLSGLMWQVARMASLVLALSGTLLFHEQAVVLVQEHLLREADGKIVEGAAYILVFLAIYVILLLMAQVMKQMLQASGFAWLDRCLGACLGTVKTAAVLGAVCLLMSRLSHPMPQEWLSRSTLAPTLCQGLEAAMALIPDETKRELADTLTQLKARVPD